VRGKRGGKTPSLSSLLKDKRRISRKRGEGGEKRGGGDSPLRASLFMRIFNQKTQGGREREKRRRGEKDPETFLINFGN